mgnify:CR=1 FL=1
MDSGVDAQLRADGVSFTAADAALLSAIAEHGSVSGAAAALGRSRARALDRVDTLESAFGPLVERQRGGASGGGSELTETARELLARFERLRAALDGAAGVAESVLAGTVVERDGELGVVETEAGQVRALLVADDPVAVGQRVQVSIRSDAVTLHDPSAPPAADATSARNHFEGVVAAVDRGDAIATVTVSVPPECPITAVLTHESLDRLGLGEGVPVVLTFKATATRATPVPGDDGST